MNRYDYYYRAFKQYKKEVGFSKSIESRNNRIIDSNKEKDKLTSIKYRCIIETDWVEAIEKGLEFVEKACAEERQFIATNGEVVPIEKVKKVSRDSVEHLAKHSNMITHKPKEGEDVVPDQIYMVEKLSDYAVYENRFLYMLLCYLKQFIAFRLEKIEKLRSSYVGDMELSKEIKGSKSDITYEIKIHEERTDNEYPLTDRASESIIKRIGNCDQIINSLLNTDLMNQVSKTPMIKPPITKTNVLKMNNNFKNSLALYDYIAGYNGDGYKVEEVKRDLAPFESAIATDVAQSVGVSLFVEYAYGNGIENILETNFNEEERARQTEEEKQLVLQIERLKKRAFESSQTLEQYALLLEKRNKQLEHNSEEIAIARNEIVKLNRQIDDLYDQIEQLKQKIKSLEAEIAAKIEEIIALNKKYIDDMAAQKAMYEEKIEKINEEHQVEIANLNVKHDLDIIANTKATEERLAVEFNDKVATLNEKREELAKEYEAKIQGIYDDIIRLNNEKQQLSDNYKAKIDSLSNELLIAKNDRDNQIKEFEEKIRKMEEDATSLLNTTKEEAQTKIDELSSSNDTLTEKNKFAMGELDALRVLNGRLTPNEEYATRERFNELEEEFEAFNKFFKEQWKFTKKEIRKQILWSKEEKPLNKKDKVEELPSYKDKKKTLDEQYAEVGEADDDERFEEAANEAASGETFDEEVSVDEDVNEASADAEDMETSADEDLAESSMDDETPVSDADEETPEEEKPSKSDEDADLDDELLKAFDLDENKDDGKDEGEE